MIELELLTAQLTFMMIEKLVLKKIMILLRRMVSVKDKVLREMIMVMGNRTIAVVKKVKHFLRYQRRR